MNHKLRILALTMASALLFLTPGPASAKITESDDRGSRPAESSANNHWAIPAAEAQRDEALLRHWGLAPKDVGGTGVAGSLDTDVGAARNDIGPRAPAAPETTPVTTEVEPGQVIGWTAAGIAAGSALVAAAMFLRRRREHLAHPV